MFCICLCCIASAAKLRFASVFNDALHHLKQLVIMFKDIGVDFRSLFLSLLAAEFEIAVDFDLV